MICGNTQQGRGCLASLNATRIAAGLEPVEAICSTCRKVGACLTPQACETSELQPIRRRLFTSPCNRERMGRIVGATLGLAGFAFFAFHAARAWGWI